MSETTEVLEDVVDLTEEVLNLTENLVRNQRNARLFVLGAGVVGLTVGAVIAWKLTEKRMNLKIDGIVADEVDQTRRFYQVMEEKPPIEDVVAQRNDLLLEQEVVAAAEMVKRYQGNTPYHKPSEIDETPEVEVHNVFVEGKVMNADDFDYDAELAQRSVDSPYVISFEEFQADEKDYQRATLTWYEGDDTLTDDKNDPIPDVDVFVGEENMVRFGHGSRDPNIVYIRNEMREMDFEVVHNKAAYASAILGFQHSDRPGSRKTPRFRGDDG